MKFIVWKQAVLPLCFTLLGIAGLLSRATAQCTAWDTSNHRNYDGRVLQAITANGTKVTIDTFAPELCSDGNGISAAWMDFGDSKQAHHLQVGWRAADVAYGDDGTPQYYVEVWDNGANHTHYHLGHPAVGVSYTYSDLFSGHQWIAACPGTQLKAQVGPCTWNSVTFTTEVKNKEDRIAGAVSNHCHFASCQIRMGATWSGITTGWTQQGPSGSANIDTNLYDQTKSGSTFEVWDKRQP